MSCERSKRIANVFGMCLPEQKEWSFRNFPENPDYISSAGGIEEAGELHHALIKGFQGIRGDFEKHLLDMRDAIGDISIYLMDFINKSCINTEDLLCAITGEIIPEFQTRETNLFCLAGDISTAVNNINQTIWGRSKGLTILCCVVEAISSCDRFCQVQEWDYPEIIMETWKEVKKRDWAKNKLDGKAD